jgi:hypothetical protein
MGFLGGLHRQKLGVSLVVRIKFAATEIELDLGSNKKLVSLERTFLKCGNWWVDGTWLKKH